MDDVVLDRIEAGERGFVAYPVALKVLGARSRNTLRAYPEIQTVLVRSQLGSRPEVWYSAEDAAALRAKGDGGRGQLGAQWQRVESDGAPRPGMHGHIQKCEDLGLLTKGSALARLRHDTGLSLPDNTLEKCADIISSEPGSAHRLGHYRVWREDALAAAVPVIRARYTPKPMPDGCITAEEAAELIGCTLKNVREAVRTGKIDAVRAPRGQGSMSVVRESAEYYATHRVPTSRSAQANLEERGLITQSEAARRFGTNGDWLRDGAVLHGHLKVERYQRSGSRKFPLYSAAEVDLLIAARPSCECGCGQPAWAWWPFARGHHFRVPAFVATKHAIEAARDRWRTSDHDPQWEERARGLCELRRRATLDRRRPRQQGDGRRVTDESLATYAQCVIGVSQEPSRTAAAESMGKTRGWLKNRLELIEAAAWVAGEPAHDASCKSCSLFG